MNNTNEKLDYPWNDLIENEPWRIEDKKEWDRLEALRLLKKSGKAIPSQDKQRVWLHESMLRWDLCWLCGHMNMAYFAQGRVLVEYAKREFRCVRCGVQLVHTVAFLSNKPWGWTRPENITAEEVIHHAQIWQQHEMQSGRPSEEDEQPEDGS